MTNLIAKYFSELINEKSLRLYEGQFSSTTHQTVVLKNNSITLSFELDRLTKDFWVTVNLKHNDKPLSIINESNVINIDFLLTQLDESFNSCDSTFALEEKLSMYSHLIARYFDILTSPSEQMVDKATKLRKKYFRSTLKV